MSLGLVAYGSSDESETSDTEEVTDDVTAQTSVQSKHNSSNANATVSGDAAGVTSQTSENISSIEVTSKSTAPIEQQNRLDPFDKDFGIEDDDDFENASNQTTGQGMGLKLPPPKHQSDKPPTQNDNSPHANGEKSSKSLLKGLPPPKPTSTMTHLADETEGELEAEVQPKQYEPPPQPPGRTKKREPVKITIPDLPDADSDDDEPCRKRPRPASGKTGLFSLLPSPKHSSIKTSNRPLIPYTLTKKTAATATSKSSSIRLTEEKSAIATNVPLANVRLPGVPDGDSDDEEETSSSNFFSLGGKLGTVGHSLAPTSVSLTPVVEKDVKPTAKDNSYAPSSKISDAGTSVTASQAQTSQVGPSLQASSTSDLENKSPQLDSPNMELADAPLSFKSSAMGGYVSRAPTWTAGAYQPSVPHDLASQQFDYQAGGEYQPPLVEDEGEELDEQEGEVTGEQDEFMKDEQFLRMQGKKHRGKEAINFIDVNADDALDPGELVKSITEEQDTRSHSRKRKDLPSSQQRRKHQITYLAFQAKERELELKNQWAQNRQTKKQTQSKYGF